MGDRATQFPSAAFDGAGHWPAPEHSGASGHRCQAAAGQPGYVQAPGTGGTELLAGSPAVGGPVCGWRRGGRRRERAGGPVLPGYVCQEPRGDAGQARCARHGEISGIAARHDRGDSADRRSRGGHGRLRLAASRRGRAGPRAKCVHGLARAGRVVADVAGSVRTARRGGTARIPSGVCRSPVPLADAGLGIFAASGIVAAVWCF